MPHRRRRDVTTCVPSGEERDGISTRVGETVDGSASAVWNLRVRFTTEGAPFLTIEQGDVSEGAAGG